MAGEQTAANILVALKRQPTLGTPPGDTGGVRLRITDSPGLVGQFHTAQSQEKRADGLTTRPRQGTKFCDGSYNFDLSAGGGHDVFLEALMRSTFSAAATRTYDNSAGLTSLEITQTNEITQVGSTTLVGVIFVGDIIYLTNMSTAANNNINLLVTGVTATVVTVAGTPLTVQAADIACEMIRRKRVHTATTPTRVAHYIEQYDQDIDLSQVFDHVRVTGMRLSFRPDEPITGSWNLMGADWSDLATGTSPYYTSPTLTSTEVLVTGDGVLVYDGAVVATFTGLDFDIQIATSVQGVIGSRVPADVFDNSMRVTGTLTGLRSDFGNLTKFANETAFELWFLAEEPTGTPPEFVSVFWPSVTIREASAPVGGGDGAKIETLNFSVDPIVASTGYAAGIGTISSSGA